MRPIKFRLWSKRWNQMSYTAELRACGWGLSSDLRNEVLASVEAHSIKGAFEEYTDSPPEMWVIEQFTGLKDKTGRDIYEGDILRIAEWNGTEVVFTQTGKVYWDPYACRFSIATDGGRGRISELNTSTDGLLSEQSRDEVVGNVHENPDLLL